MTKPANTDARLLAEYASGGAGAAAAFERLVAAHGGMVHGVCLRILGRADLAEDAAQAALLVLARKAGSVRGDAAAFLQGVAVNVALRARESELARRAREKEAAMASMQRPGGGSAADWERIRPHLDEAIARLPAGERAAVTLHYLESRTHAEVAGRLAVPEGTVASRLNRAVGRMREFFRKRDVALSAEALPGLLAAGVGGAGAAACPAYLLAATGKLALAGSGAAGMTVVGTVGAQHAVPLHVVHLAKGALKAMFWMKVKLVAAVVVAAAMVSTAVPMTVQAVRGEEEAKSPGATATVQPQTGKRDLGDVLEFRRLSAGGLNAMAPNHFVLRTRDEALGFAAQAKDPIEPAVVMSPEEHRQYAAQQDEQWLAAFQKANKVDFAEEQVVGIYLGNHSGEPKPSVRVERIRVQEDAMWVECTYVAATKRSETVTEVFDLVACPRRDLPVVFCVNGKEVARVPFKAAEERGLNGSRGAGAKTVAVQDENAISEVPLGELNAGTAGNAANSPSAPTDVQARERAAAAEAMKRYAEQKARAERERTEREKAAKAAAAPEEVF